MIDLNKDNYTKSEVEQLIADASEKQRGITSKANQSKIEGLQSQIAELQGSVTSLTNEKTELSTKLGETTKKVFDLEVKPKIKDEFTKLGGNEKMFDDFMTLHGTDLTAEGVDQVAKLTELKTNKGHFFTGEVKERTLTPEEIDAAKRLGEPANVSSAEPGKKTAQDFIDKSNPYS